MSSAPFAPPTTGAEPMARQTAAHTGTPRAAPSGPAAPHRPAAPGAAASLARCRDLVEPALRRAVRGLHPGPVPHRVARVRMVRAGRHAERRGRGQGSQAGARRARGGGGGRTRGGGGPGGGGDRTDPHLLPDARRHHGRRRPQTKPRQRLESLRYGARTAGRATRCSPSGSVRWPRSAARAAVKPSVN